MTFSTATTQEPLLDTGTIQRSPRAKTVWSPERRARQSAMMRANQIWKKSTGPKTAAGKARSALNATKHGHRGREWREFYALLAAQRVCVRNIMARRKIKALGNAAEKNATNELLKPTSFPPLKTDYRFHNFNPVLRAVPCAGMEGHIVTDLKRIFETNVVDRLRQLPLAAMPGSVYKILGGFDRKYLHSHNDNAETTFSQLGFQESANPLASFLAAKECWEWLPYPKSARKEDWIVLPIRDLDFCERTFPALKSILLGAAAPINTLDLHRTVPEDFVHHFRSAAVNARATSVGLGFAAVSIPNSRTPLCERRIDGQMMKMELVKF